MKFKKLLVTNTTNTVVLSMIFILLTFNGVMAQTKYWYDPTGDTTDARFLTVAGPGFETLIKQPVTVYINVPANENGFEIGIFDGDTRGTDASGKEHWDSRAGFTELRYDLYADPNKTGVGGLLIDSWLGNTDNMPDNDWYSIVLPTHAQALGPNGYTYRLMAQLVDPTSSTASRFKVRATAPLVVGSNSAFTFEAALTGAPDLFIIYPGFPALTPTTYDGTWEFKIFVKGPDPTYEVGEITVWDGDLDRGSWDGSDPDTDDPDTPNNVLPPFASDTTQFEGEKIKGIPSDNVSTPALLREPAIRYYLIAPDGTEWWNSNPSGNSEWEKFTIRSNSHPAGCIPGENADECVNVLKQGIYSVKVDGVDINNLNAFFFPYEVFSSTAGSIGDYVWNDLNDNGIQDDGELGIKGVTVELYNGQGILVSTTTTDPTGFYMFPNLMADNYTIKVADSNFATGGVLAGWDASPANQGSDDAVNSDGDEICHETEVKLKEGEDNNTIDFGFLKYGSIGDYAWNDLDGDGIQDSGEKGIGGVTVGLYNDQGILLNTVITDTNGYYLFDNLLAGNYTVKLANSNFVTGGVLADWLASPANQGSNDKLDSDGNEITHQAAVTLAAGEDNKTIDFGFFARGGGQGCTPGYWKQKQHFDSWVKYQPTDSFAAIFGVPYNLTLLQALEQGGGGKEALGRHAVAALLNAAVNGVSYYYIEREIIAMVQQAWATGDYETPKNLLATENERGCPLN